MKEPFINLVRPKAEERPKKTYYYVSKSGEIFAANAREADLIHSKYKQYGVSDGSVYYKKMSEAYMDQQELLGELRAKDLGEQSSAWHKERKEISDKAKQAIKDASKADQEAAKDNFETPPNTKGEIVGRGADRSMGLICRMINKR